MTEQRILAVKGMTCTGCEERITSALDVVTGVEEAWANHEEGRVNLRFDPAVAGDDVVRAAIEKLGSGGGVMRIGEVGNAVGVDPPTIRYYESVGVLPEPDRTASGYRMYSATDVERLRFVTLARSLGLGLDDIRDILGLRDMGEAPCGYVRGVLDRQVDAVAERIRQLKALSTELRRLQRVARTLPDIDSEDPCVCHILQPAGAQH